MEEIITIMIVINVIIIILAIMDLVTGGNKNENYIKILLSTIGISCLGIALSKLFL